MSAETREQVARVAHELNTPLSIVSGSLATLEHYIGLLVRQGAATEDGAADENREVVEKVVALLRLCREGARRLEHVGRQLRSCGAAPGGGWERIDLRLVLEQAIRFAAAGEASPARVDLEVTADLPPVRGLGESLGQAFVNLVRNAIEAVAGEPEPRVRVRARADLSRRGWVEISVSDNGPGVSPEMRRQLFRPFRSTKGARGMGLGLAIARDVVEQHGGSIALVPGASAEFVVRLPVAEVGEVGVFDQPPIVG